MLWFSYDELLFLLLTNIFHLNLNLSSFLPALRMLILLFFRNHMCVRSRVVPNVTRTPALSGSTLRQCTVPKLTSPRNNEATLLRDCSRLKATGRTKRTPNTEREAAQTAKSKPTAPLEEWKTAYKSNLSRLKTLWCVLIILILQVTLHKSVL